MTDKEISSKSAIFLLIGILLVLSLIICIYIVSKEKDLVKVSATVVSVKEDQDGTGKNDVTVNYIVDDENYEYSFYYKDDLKVDDKVPVYYHEDNVRSVQPYKTSKLIFLCPVLGLLLCIYGLFELFFKARVKYSLEDDDIMTKIIDEDDKTQQLKIIVNDEDISDLQEVNGEEAPIKAIKEKEEIIDDEDEIVIEDDIFNTKEIINITDLVSEKVERLAQLVPISYYISGSCIIYEIEKDKFEELNLMDIEEVVRVTDQNNKKIIKIKLITHDNVIVLKRIKGLSINQVANTIHNKMLSLKDNFQEYVEFEEE